MLKSESERVRRTRSELWAEKRMDSASGQCTVFVTREFLAKNNITTIDYPPYSPDLAPYDFYLFPKVKNIMRDEHFVAIDIIKRETSKLLQELIKEDMQHCFQEWEKRLIKCILSGRVF